jgi:hypothetical protein
VAYLFDIWQCALSAPGNAQRAPQHQHAGQDPGCPCRGLDADSLWPTYQARMAQQAAKAKEIDWGWERSLEGRDLPHRHRYRFLQSRLSRPNAYRLNAASKAAAVVACEAHR